MRLTKEQKNNIVWDMVIQGIFGVENGQVYRLKRIDSNTGVYISCKIALKYNSTIIRYEKNKHFGYMVSHIAVLCHGGQPIQENELVHHHDLDHFNNKKSNLFIGEKDGSDSHTAFHHKNKIVSDEIRKKISESHKGLKASEEHKRNISEGNKGEKSCWFGKFGKDHSRAKPILQLTKDEKFIREWGSTIEAARELKIHQSNICSCLQGKYSHAGNFIWKYKES